MKHTDRERAFFLRLGALTGCHPAYLRQIVDVLRRDDAAMAELMALCARPGPAKDDSAWEYVADSGEPMVRDVWVHGGSGLLATHHLPEPGQPHPTTAKDQDG